MVNHGAFRICKSGLYQHSHSHHHNNHIKPIFMWDILQNPWHSKCIVTISTDIYITNQCTCDRPCNRNQRWSCFTRKYGLPGASIRRIELWQFHRENFLREPLFGAGPFSLDRKSFTITDSEATSEIARLPGFLNMALLQVPLSFFGDKDCLSMHERSHRPTGVVEIGYLFNVLIFASLTMVFLV